MKKLIVLLVLGIFVLGGLAYAINHTVELIPNIPYTIKVVLYYQKVNVGAGSASGTYRIESNRPIYLYENTMAKVIGGGVTNSRGELTIITSYAPSKILGAYGPGPYAVGEQVSYGWPVASRSGNTIYINTAVLRDNWEAQVIDAFEASDVLGGDAVDADDASSGSSPTLKRTINVAPKVRLPR